MKVAEFDILHKACLVKHEKKVINDQEFFNEWARRLKVWIGEWYKLYNKAHKDLTTKEFVEKSMKSTYLEQMKVEAPTEEAALERYDDIVDFVTDCIPDYLPNDDRPENLPIRMQMVKELFTKTPDEIRASFEEKLTDEFTQYREKFKMLLRSFTRHYFPLLVCWDISCSIVTPNNLTHLLIGGQTHFLKIQTQDLNLNIPVRPNILIKIETRGLNLDVSPCNFYEFKRFFEYWQKVGDLMWAKYKKEYEEKGLPKGYTSVSMIWGGILQGGFKGNTGIVNFFIQCAEDNALCTLVTHVNDNNVNLACQKVSWYAFYCQNECQKGNCKDSNCPEKKCEKYECYKKPLCPFCKVGFKDRVMKNLHIDESQLHIDGENVSYSDDFDEGDIDYVNLNLVEGRKGLP